MSDRARKGRLTLREAREKRVISRERVAAKVDISTKTLERYEGGKIPARGIEPGLLESLADIYGIGPEDFRL